MTLAGLLSLNVHDALTFEGIELCLHPDLFESPHGRIPPPQSSSSPAAGTPASSASPSTFGGTHGGSVRSRLSASSFGGGAPALAHSQSEDATVITAGSLKGTPYASVLKEAPGVPPNAPRRPASKLAVGDMIEIRVWDPLPKEEIAIASAVADAAGHSPTSTSVLLRKTVVALSSAASQPASVVRDAPAVVQDTPHPETAGSPVSSRRPSPPSSTASSMASAHKPDQSVPSSPRPERPNRDATNDSDTGRPRGVSVGSATLNTQHSLQYSEASSSDGAPPDSRHVEHRSSASNADKTQADDVPTPPVVSPKSSLRKDASVRPTAKSPSGTSFLPPVFPRAKQGTGPDPTASPSAVPVPSISTPTFSGIFSSGNSRASNVASGTRTTTSAVAGDPTRAVARSPRGSPDQPQQSQRSPPSVPHGSNGQGTSGWRMSGASHTLNRDKSPPSMRHIRDISDMTVDSHTLSTELAELRQQQSTAQNDHSHLMPQLPAGAKTTSQHDIASTKEALAKISRSHRLRLSFVMLVTPQMMTSIKSTSRTQISMLRQVADLYGLSSYDMVTVHKIFPEEVPQALKAVSADFVVVTIKDQFVSRADMHLFQESLIGSWIYEGQRLRSEARGVVAHAKQIQHDKNMAKSGIVTKDTNITFRSRSARIVWLVQLSSEMWDYTSPYGFDRHQYDPDGGRSDHPTPHQHSESICELYFDRWIRFVRKLFIKWKQLDVSHSLTVVFFSRTVLKDGQESRLGYKDVYNRAYEDHYKTVIENETCADWTSLIVRIKEEFVRWPLDLQWDRTTRRPSSANQGNLLEAINVTLNLMQFHFLDRDLHRTGNSIVIISPGCGLFEVDKRLASITYQRMMDNGIGSDMLSLGLPPLHITPFFLYSNDYNQVREKGVDAQKLYYEIPHWMHLSFIAYDDEDEGNANVGPIDSTDDRTNVNKTSTADDVGCPLQEFELGANGFLWPRSGSDIRNGNVNSRSPTLKAKVPSSFSAAGNAAATPKQEISTQQRQLISGRSLRDILEACRPRLAGTSLPSPLLMLLKMYEYARKIEGGESSEAAEAWFFDADDRRVGLTEWGKVDFAETQAMLHKQNAKIRANSSRLLMRQNSDTQSSDAASDAASATSSYASQISSLFGMSYDKVMWSQLHSPVMSKGAVQLQRSPSLEFAYLPDSRGSQDDFDANSSDCDKSMTSASTVKSTQDDFDGMLRSKPSPAEGGSGSNNHNNRKKTARAEKLRQLMRMRDSSYFTASSDKDGETSSVELMYPDPDAIPLKSAPSAEAKTRSGGIGAALSQYSNNAPPSSSTNAAVSGSRNNPLATRVSSGSSIAGLARDRSDTGVHGMLISPPGRGTSQSSFDNMTQPPLMTRTLSMTRAIPTGEARAVGSSVFSSLNVRSGSYQGMHAAPSNPPTTLFSHVPSVLPLSSDMASSSNSGSSQPVLDSRRSPPKQMKPTKKLEGKGLSPAVFSKNAAKPSSLDDTGRHIRQPRRARPSRPADRSLSVSPPTGRALLRDPSSEKKSSPKSVTKMGSASPPKRQSMKTRRVRAFNPFRQSDEDVVLAIKSHNRRRWSHVFPAGEVEFKRHSGPNWKSLTAPAILPLYVDHYPSQHELNNAGIFQFTPYTITLDGIEHKHYATNEELLMEMVRQRLAQDYQLVTEPAVRRSETNAEFHRQATRKSQLMKGRSVNQKNFIPTLPTIKADTSGMVTHHLSMGHRIQRLTYDASSDTIQIVSYYKRGAQNDPSNTFSYRFFLYSAVSASYAKSMQTFKKYAEPYKWTKFDNMVCGEEDRWVEEGMKFRRMLFGLIPPRFSTHVEEQAYITRFSQLKEYLSKLRKKDKSDSGFEVQIVSSKDERQSRKDEVTGLKRTTFDAMIRFNVQMRQKKTETFEWLELAVDSVFDTSRTYRIMFSWLVASSATVEAQVQLFQRRCSHFGLNLENFSQSSVSRDLLLNSFVIPPYICVRNECVADSIDEALLQGNYVDDGVYFTYGKILECIDGSDDFSFARFKSSRIRPIPSRQFVHRSGILFVRKLRDQKGWVILVVIPNTQHALRHSLMQYRANLRRAYAELRGQIDRIEVAVAAGATDVPASKE